MDIFFHIFYYQFFHIQMLNLPVSTIIFLFFLGGVCGKTMRFCRGGQAKNHEKPQWGEGGRKILKIEPRGF